MVQLIHSADQKGGMYIQSASNSYISLQYFTRILPKTRIRIMAAMIFDLQYMGQRPRYGSQGFGRASPSQLGLLHSTFFERVFRGCQLFQRSLFHRVLVLRAISFCVKTVGILPGIEALAENVLDGLLSNDDLEKGEKAISTTTWLSLISKKRSMGWRAKLQATLCLHRGIPGRGRWN